MDNSIFIELEEEKQKILKMVEEGKISAEDADKMIWILENSVIKEQARVENKESKNDKNTSDLADHKKKIDIPDVKGKLLIHVYENGIKKVNIQLPISIIKIAKHLPMNIDNRQIQIDDFFNQARESGFNIYDGLFILVNDDEVHMYDADGNEFITVTD
jgi:polyhydroxyalkanoate synthesis regulator phasin